MKYDYTQRVGNVTAKFEDSHYDIKQNVTFINETKNYVVSWYELNHRVDELANALKDKGYDRVVGVARGGCVPAVMLSNRLNIAYEQIVWQTRDGSSQEIEKLKQMRDVGGKTLIVDDLIDSGLTITQIKAIAPQFDVAVLYAKTETKLANYIACAMYGDPRWLVFPWE